MLIVAQVYTVHSPSLETAQLSVWPDCTVTRLHPSTHESTTLDSDMIRKQTASVSSTNCVENMVVSLAVSRHSILSGWCCHMSYDSLRSRLTLKTRIPVSCQSLASVTPGSLPMPAPHWLVPHWEVLQWLVPHELL